MVADADDPGIARLASKLERQLESPIVGVLDDAILELSRKHGVLTYWQVKRKLKQPWEMASGFEEAMAEYFAAAQILQKAQEEQKK